MSTSSITEKKRRGRGFGPLQRLGKSLMLPIAVLPAAGLLMRLGQPDLLGAIDAPVIGPFFDAMSAGGGALFDNLALLFAVGVAIGFAKNADGSTALSAVAGYLVITAVFETMSPIVLAGVVDQAGEQATIDYSVLAGILVGLVTAWLFDRYHDIELPEYLGFFAGRRFVPIVVSLACLVLGFAMAYAYPAFAWLLTGVGQFIGASGAIGAFAYGFANRMLIPFGLHHILNTYVWFVYGEYPTDAGVVTGELTRFIQGDPTAGALTSGFYPILMFGLPAAALAMMHEARPGRRKIAGGILTAAALTAFLTGITEPLEFAFMFVAFPLYVVHALLTGASMAVSYLLDIHLGFSFSAGLIDLILFGTAPAAQNIPLLVAQGLAFAALYYVLFRVAIRVWNMRTPGREDDAALTDITADGATPGDTGAAGQAEALIAAFGGRGNLRGVDACITRLRMEVGDPARVDKGALRALGAAGVVQVGDNVQAVFGTKAEALATDIRGALSGQPAAPVTAAAPTTAAPPPASAAPTAASGVVVAPLSGTAVSITDVPDPTFAEQLMGPGAALRPAKEAVAVVSPISGRISQIWPHAFTVIGEDGVGVLVHLGIDTVKLRGEGFLVHAAQGDRCRPVTR